MFVNIKKPSLNISVAIIVSHAIKEQYTSAWMVAIDAEKIKERKK
jgi:hypothetical protein